MSGDDLPEEGMDAAAFLEWAAWRPERHELIEGRPVRLMGERWEHDRARTEIRRQLEAQIPPGGSYRVLSEATGISVAEDTLLFPDLLVLRGEGAAPEGSSPESAEAAARDAALIVEIMPPSTPARELALKMKLYARLPGLDGVLFVDLPDAAMIQRPAGRLDFAAGGVVEITATGGAAPAAPWRIDLAAIAARVSPD